MNKYHDKQYLALVEDVLENGTCKENRTGIKTYSSFGLQMKFDLSDGSIPLLTTKKMHVRSIIHEILWYLQGSGNIKYLTDNKVTIWDEWANEQGDLGPVYGVQWRSWARYTYVPAHAAGYNWVDAEYVRRDVDQIGELIRTLKTDPDSRRMLVSAWNVSDLNKMALPPCHYSFQCWTKPVGDTRELHMIVNQRSCDVGLGVPFNVVQYSILLRMIAHVVDMKPGKLIWNGGDVHIYENHKTQLTEQIQRIPTPSPTLKFARKISDIDNFEFDDFIIENYNPLPAIKMDVAV